MISSMPAPRTILFVVYDGAQLIEFAGPADVFTAANHAAGEPAYQVVTASPRGRAVTMHGGHTLHADRALEEIAAGAEAIDTMIVIGGAGIFDTAVSLEVVPHLPALARRSRRVASVCAGSLLLAAAGLLDGYRATTHWNQADAMARRYPRVDVDPDAIYVHDRNRWTSAGVTAGIDLALALVETDRGTEQAQQIARWFVMPARRPAGQPQVGAQLRAQPARTPAIRAVQLWLSDHLDEDLTVATLARRAGMSERNFARAFRAETGTTPAAFVEDLRIEAAERLLESTDLTVAAIARLIGYRHAETLHRVVLRRLRMTPESYRRHARADAAPTPLLRAAADPSSGG